jgi:type IV secretory pathway protease TraF
MGSSLILKGGASTPKTVLETIIRANSFVSGDVVRYDPSVGAAGTWYRSQANSAENAEVVGVVQNASATSFDVVYSGFISLSGYAGVSAPVLFLSAEVPGGLTSSPPSALGTVV